jgi:hypothetical protein
MSHRKHQSQRVKSVREKSVFIVTTIRNADALCKENTEFSSLTEPLGFEELTEMDSLSPPHVLTTIIRVCQWLYIQGNCEYHVKQ